MPLRTVRWLLTPIAMGSLMFSALGATGCRGESAYAQPRSPVAAPRPQTNHAAAQPHQAAQPPPPPTPAPPAQAVRPTDQGFFGTGPDAPILARLSGSEIQRVERGYGGRSVAFKIELADGTKGYYKPEQTFSAAHWYAEVAAFHLDRELGLGRVPPVVGRRFEWQRLRRAAPGDARFSEVVVQEDGTVRGAFVWWIPDRLFPWRTGTGWERWVRFQGAPLITPFQRARVYADQQNRRRTENELPREIARPTGRRATTPDLADRPAELSDLILFDYLTQNVDRWGGGNANVLTRGRPGPIVFLDNAAGFLPNVRRNGLMDARLHVVQKFRRATVDAIRALDVRRWAARMSHDPLAPILTDEQIAGFEERRRDLLAHVAQMQTTYGDGVFAW